MLLLGKNGLNVGDGMLRWCKGLGTRNSVVIGDFSEVAAYPAMAAANADAASVGAGSESLDELGISP